jgi:hypothetical protein
MSFGRLSEQFRTGRFKQRAADRSTITVRRVDPPAGLHRFSGRVIVDRQRLGYLLGGQPRTFDAEPGEHTITVFFGRRPAILSSRGRATAAASFSLRAGERADFACGIRREVVHLWAQARRAREIHLAVITVAFVLAIGLNWLLGPYFREVAAWAVLHLPIDGSLIPFFYRMVGPAFFGFWLAILNGWMLRRWPHLRHTNDEALISRIGSPFYLERLAPIGVEAE